MEIPINRLSIASNPAVVSQPQKNMVLTRTNGQQSTASSTTNSNNKNNVNGMISFETRGSTSFDAREKKFGNKYAHKSRNHGRDEFIMLQRPTPIILAKPSIREHETSPVVTLHRQKDENSKPSNKQLATDQRLLHSITTATTPTLMNNGHSKDKSDQQQPILANLSTNLKSLSTNQLSEAANRSSTKEYAATNVSIASKESSSVLATGPPDSVSARLTTAAQFMKTPVQLLDENLSWKDNLGDFLADQSDFLVVGVLGKRGSGKSTLMSLLAGTKFNQATLFKESSASNTASHKDTSGVRAFVTSERTILLDVQPLLSSSLLDKAIGMDNKKQNANSNSSDFKYYENFIEMQSIELACLILSICNVVLVTEDCFIDPNLFRLLQTAEMLMPSNVVQSGENQDMLQWDQKYPHLVYVLNKCEAMNKSDLKRMKAGIDRLLSDSKLVYKNSLPEMTSSSSRVLRAKKRPARNKGECENSVNFVVLPKVDSQANIKQKSLEFEGMASLERTIKCLTRDILAIRCNNNVAFTEKKWLAYANRVWDTIRKSPLITEYNRLMT